MPVKIVSIAYWLPKNAKDDMPIINLTLQISLVCFHEREVNYLLQGGTPGYMFVKEADARI